MSAVILQSQPHRSFAETLLYRVVFTVVHVCVHVFLYALPCTLHAVLLRAPAAVLQWLCPPLRAWWRRRDGAMCGCCTVVYTAAAAAAAASSPSPSSLRSLQLQLRVPHARRVHIIADARRPRVVQFFGFDTTSAATITAHDKDDVGSNNMYHDSHHDCMNDQTMTQQLLLRGYDGPLYSGHIHTCLGNYRPLHRVRAQRQTLLCEDGCRLCLDWVYPTHMAAVAATATATATATAATTARSTCGGCCRRDSRAYARRRRGGEAAEYTAAAATTTTSHTSRALTPPPPAVVFVLPGLTGSSAEVYVSRLVHLLQQRGYVVAILNTRGVAGVPLDAPELFSALHTDDVRYVMTHELTAARLCERFGCGGCYRCRSDDEDDEDDVNVHAQTSGTADTTTAAASPPRARRRGCVPVFAIAFSYGGVVLSNYLGEQGSRHVASGIDAAYTLNAPHDLCVCSRVMRRPWQRWTYNLVLSRRLRQYVQEHRDVLQGLHGRDGQQLLCSSRRGQGDDEEANTETAAAAATTTTTTTAAHETDDADNVSKPHHMHNTHNNNNDADDHTATTTTATTTSTTTTSHALCRLRTLHDFDSRLIAPHLGYGTVAAYYAAADNFANLRASHTPQLCLVSVDDPMCCEGLSRGCAAQWATLARAHAGGLVCVILPTGGHLGCMRGPLDELRQRANVMELLVLSSLAHATRAWRLAPL